MYPTNLSNVNVRKRLSGCIRELCSANGVRVLAFSPVIVQNLRIHARVQRAIWQPWEGVFKDSNGTARVTCACSRRDTCVQRESITHAAHSPDAGYTSFRVCRILEQVLTVIQWYEGVTCVATPSDERNTEATTNNYIPDNHTSFLARTRGFPERWSPD